MVYQVKHKNKRRIERIFFDNSDVKIFSKSQRNVHDRGPDPFISSADPGSGSASASKLNGLQALIKTSILFII